LEKLTLLSIDFQAGLEKPRFLEKVFRFFRFGVIETQDLFVCFIDYEKAFDNARHV